MIKMYSKIKYLLTPSERRSTYVLFTFMAIGMLLETLGIGLIIPVISLMMQGDLISKYPVVTSIFNYIGIPSQTNLIMVVMLSLVGIYLIKNIFLAFLSWKQTHFTYDLQVNLSKRLFTMYLRQPYTFHLQRNSAELVRNVYGEVNIFSGIITSILILTTEFMVLVGIFMLLLIIEPLAVLIIAVVLGGSAWSFNRVTRKRLLNWGIERQFHEGLRLQHLQQGLSGAKDVKLLGRESDFINQYHIHNIKSARVWKLQSILQSFPRLMFELLAVMGLAILVITMLSQGRDMLSIIPTLGLFSAAAFRLMPSVIRILNSVQSISFSLPVVNTLYEEILQDLPESIKQKNTSNNIFQNKLELTDIQYQYPDATSNALEQISLSILKGESIGLIGSSGSGKSTLVDIILGLLTPSSGTFVVDGQEIQQTMRQWQNQIGYVPQSIYLTDDTFRRNIAFGLPDDQIDNEAVKRAIHAAQLDEFILGLPDGAETIVGERGIRISGGQRQRIGIARALYHDPDVLVLDEATSALDTATENSVMDAVMELHGKKTIIIVAHRLSTVEHCDRLYRLEKGKVIEEGYPDDVIFSSMIN